MTWKHGSYGYSGKKCRCAVCKAGHTAAQQQGIARRKARLEADPTLMPHGQRTTYSNWGCRCEECRAAMRRRVSRFTATGVRLEVPGGRRRSYIEPFGREWTQQ